MEQRKLGTQGLARLGRGARLHGHERVLRRGRRGRSRSRRSTAPSSSASPSSTRPTCTARSRTRSWSAARSAGRRERVVLATKFGNERARGRDLRRRQRQARVRPRGLRRVARAASASTTIDLYYQHRVDPTVPIEETVGAMAELVQAGQGPLPRALRGGAGDDPARARGPPDHRAADRVLALEPRPRGRDPADRPRARHRLRRLQPARPRLPHRPLPSAGGPRRGRLPAQLARASRARTSQRNLDLVEQIQRHRRRRRA